MEIIIMADHQFISKTNIVLDIIISIIKLKFQYRVALIFLKLNSFHFYKKYKSIEITFSIGYLKTWLTSKHLADHQNTQNTDTLETLIG